MGRLIYLPALGPSDIEESGNREAMLKEYGFINNFLTKKNTAFYYPYYLISAYYGMNSPDMKRKNGLEATYCLGDSGGFQNVTLNANLDPIRVLKWQEENCTAGLMLDVPPFEATGTAAFGKSSDATFKKALDMSIVNGTVALKNKSKPEFLLYGVIQGDSNERRRLWYSSMRNIEVALGKTFDGWALSPKPSHDIREIAQHFVIIKEEKIEKPLHILQVTGFEGLAFVAFLTTLHDQDITVDSSTFSYGRRFFIYKCPYDPKMNYHIGQNKDNDLKELPCSCPVCDKISMSEIQKEREQGTKSLPGMLISLHNMYQTISFVKFLNSIKDDAKIFKDFCEQHFGEDFVAVLEYVKYALKVGHEKSWRTHILKSHNLNSYFGNHIEEKTQEDLQSLDEVYDEYGEIPRPLAIRLWEHRSGKKWIG
jgi:queuine/archaeosine tRNA-ribosyltransferase